MFRMRLARWAVGVVAVAILAGCGGSDSNATVGPATTPSTNVAAGAGVIAYLTRYVVHRRAFWTVTIGFVLCFLGVLWMQLAGSGESGPATALKWLGILMFMGINVVLLIDVLWVAVNPYFVRLDERRAAGN